MLLLKEKEIGKVIDEDAYVQGSKHRVLPSRASYYADTRENSYIPEEKEEYSVALVRGGRASKMSEANKYEDDLSLAGQALNTQTGIQEYEKLSPDLMPSTATMNSIKTNYYAEEIESSQDVVDFKVNKKGMLMIMVYAAIIIAIFTAIIINAVSLVGLMNDTSALEQQIVQESMAIESLQNNINAASDPELLYNKAINELGMTEKGIDGTIVLTAAESGQEKEIERSTNLYDWILDLFGGGF